MAMMNAQASVAVLCINVGDPTWLTYNTSIGTSDWVALAENVVSNVNSGTNSINAAGPRLALTHFKEVVCKTLAKERKAPLK